MGLPGRVLGRAGPSCCACPAGLPACGLASLVCSLRQRPRALPSGRACLAVTQLSHRGGLGAPHWSVQNMCAFCRQQRPQSRGLLDPPLGVTPPRAVKIEVTSGPQSVAPEVDGPGTGAVGGELSSAGSD